MHVNCRIVGRRGEGVMWYWFYRWGFGIWLGRFLFGFGHDTRCQEVTNA